MPCMIGGGILVVAFESYELAVGVGVESATGSAYERSRPAGFCVESVLTHMKYN